MEKEIKPMVGVSCKNKRGEWVPAIEEPYTDLMVYTCRCGKKFFMRKSYNAHYALEHILAL